MNLTNERQFFLWSLIGPLLALATALLMVYHPTPLTAIFACIMVLGQPACWYGKKWGVVISSFVLILLLAFNINIIATDYLWYSGIVLSIILTLFIAESSFEQATLLIEELSVNSASAQKIEEKYKADIDALKFQYGEETDLHQKKLEGLFQELKAVREEHTQFKEIIKEAQKDVQSAKKEADSAKNEAEAIKNELAAKSVKAELLLEELLEKRKEVFQLREQLQEIQEEWKKFSTEENDTPQDDAELQNLRDLINKKEQDLFNVQFRLDSALEDIQKQGKELAKFQNEDVTQKKLYYEIFEQCESLKKEKDLFELTVHKLQNETEQLHSLKKEKERLEDLLNSTLKELEAARVIQEVPKEKEQSCEIVTNSKEPDLTQEYNLRRRSEAMYLQLKEQFNEKSAILDETRRNLFHKEETVLQLQKRLKEYEQFSLDPQVRDLIEHIVKMHYQFERRDKMYMQEIDTLHDIIAKLNIR